jgi:hypothetical protein
MNIRKIKMALTIGLMDQQTSNLIGEVQNLMNNLSEEVGAYLGSKVVRMAKLNPTHVQQTYAFQYERCTVNVDLISNPATNMQMIRNFSLAS